MNSKLPLILLGFTLIIACGGLPVAQPDTGSANSQADQTPPKRAASLAATVEPVSPTPGDPESYRLSEPILLPAAQNGTFFGYLGWMDDDSQLLAYTADRETGQIASLVAFPIAADSGAAAAAAPGRSVLTPPA